MNRKLVVILLVGVVPILGACVTRQTSSLDQGLALYRDARYEAATLAFDNAVHETPQNAAAWNDRAAARMHMGQLVAAIGDYTKAIELTPTDPELYFNRANAYMALGNYDFAVQDLNRAIDLAPQYGKAYFNRGTARLRMGDRTGADADWRYAIAIEPDPWTQAAMVRSAGLGSPRARTAVADIPGTLTTAAASTTLSPPPSAMPAFRDVPPASDVLDARALALRGLSRDLDGDRAGALADLRAAQAKETDPARLARLDALIHELETAP
jgi:tetratricopeptide (TPR) repeat protein